MLLCSTSPLALLRGRLLGQPCARHCLVLPGYYTSTCPFHHSLNLNTTCCCLPSCLTLLRHPLLLLCLDAVLRERWGDVETELFYRALRHFGTDFTLIAQLFPKRDRRHIKNKFNKELRAVPDKASARQGDEQLWGRCAESCYPRMKQIGGTEPCRFRCNTSISTLMFKFLSPLCTLVCRLCCLMLAPCPAMLLCMRVCLCTGERCAQRPREEPA